LTTNHPARQKRFCHFCGGRLVQKKWEGRTRPFCRMCEQPIYENPVPASAIVVVAPDSRLLLTKRSVDPKKGLWCLPGGFMELSEAPEESALRELHEETGISGVIRSLLGVRSNHSDRYGTVLIVGYLITDYSGVLVPGDDAEEADFFAPDGLPEIAFESHEFFIEAALKMLAES
jgi:8-oxo-dGTP diphosphatase